MIGRAPEPDPGKCRGCGGAILWIRSVQGKAVPLDPEPYRGFVLSKKEARELRGTSDLRRGYNRYGEVVAIRVGGQQLLLDSERERETIWETHFASCPRRRAFRRLQARRRNAGRIPK